MNQDSVHQLHLARLLAAAAAGATVMYLLDPERGAPRRARSVARLRNFGRHTGNALDKAVHDLGAAMDHAGAAAQRPRNDAHEDSNANALTDAIGSAFGTARNSNSAAQQRHYAGDGGEGRYPARSVPAHTGDTGGSAGSGRSHGLFSGGALSLIGLLGPRSPISFALGLAGLVLMSRSAIVTSRPASQGATKHQRLMTVDRSIRIDADPEQVYTLFANYDNFPRYMANVLSVRDLGHGRSHWVIQGPAGSEISWNSVLTENSPPRRLAWESEPGSEIAQSGEVLLEPVRSGTRVTVRLRYRPPAGALGQALASLLGSDPGRQLEQDLARMKALAEHGGADGSSSAAAQAESAVLH
ncbi:SRPBCC family protein [Massilia sp. CF038]|uniref:SRPBCC family protein n=1 Tax=Massilia sp. CF038 TaxID=1881045 RepID=UPI00091BC9D8|nr:SRPBCC family protein [Massilia sp. CF038]SHG67026.1 Uncharacterized membrane protein [Massilia sp. CF038]